MPLDASGLESDLETFFTAPPAAGVDCAAEWASIIESYASGVVPASTTVSSAAASLETALAAAFATPAAAALFDAAFLTFATTMAGGMAAGGFTAVAPPAPLAISGMLLTSRDTFAQAAADFAAHIDVWFRTGTAAPNPPGTVFVPWS